MFGKQLTTCASEGLYFKKWGEDDNDPVLKEMRWMQGILVLSEKDDSDIDEAEGEDDQGEGEDGSDDEQNPDAIDVLSDQEEVRSQSSDFDRDTQQSNMSRTVKQLRRWIELERRAKYELMAKISEIKSNLS